MLLSKRAKTWDISESEEESYSEVRPKSTCDSVSIGKSNVIPSSDEINDELEKNLSIVPGKLSDDKEQQELESLDTLSLPSTAAPGTPSPGKRRRRTREEIKADKLNAEQKRETRDKLRRERALEKEEKKKEQKRRKEAAERLKCYRPENCLKCLEVCVDTALLQYEGSDTLLGTLLAMEWQSTIEEQDLAHSITWKNKLPKDEDKLGPVQEEQVLMVLSTNDFLCMVVSIKKTQQEDLTEVTEEPLFKNLSEYLNRNGEKTVTLAVVSSAVNYRTLCTGQKHAQILGSQLGLGEMDIEEALVFLQLYKNISIIFLEGWEDLTDHVCAVTKALSKRPFKELTESHHLPFCVDGSWASGVRVERDGSGLKQVWSRQIQQLNRVSPFVAAAVSAAFPSPQLLLQAYRDSASEGKQNSLLADLSVKSGGKERRIGPEISNRVYRFFFAQNPQLVLD